MNMTSQQAADQTISADVAESYDSLLLELSGPGSDMKFNDPGPGNALYSNGNIEFWYNGNAHDNVVPQKTPTDLASDTGYPRAVYGPRLEQETFLEAPDPVLPEPRPDQCEEPPSYESLFSDGHGGHGGHMAAVMSQCATSQGTLATIQEHTRHGCVNDAVLPWKIEADTHGKIQADASWNIAQAIYKYPWAGSAGFSLVCDAMAMPVSAAVAAQAARASAAAWTAHYQAIHPKRK